ncbi:unnamed protein product [marine sediment metagenome]|uniref:Uncharacterized protein n=1 Tax=marine sediment metagenome TaxID=412755 RepID=X1M616_9ZZZZ
MNKLLNAGIALMSAGVVGILFAVVMELRTAEPVYYLVMKLTAGLFGVGGPLVGIAIAKRGKKH